MRVTRGRVLSTGGPYLSVQPKVTEGCRPSLWCQVPVGGVAGREGQPVRSLTSAQRHESIEAIDRCLYVVAVTSARPIPTRQGESRVAETSSKAVRCLPHSVTSILPRGNPLCFGKCLPPTPDCSWPATRIAASYQGEPIKVRNQYGWHAWAAYVEDLEATDWQLADSEEPA